MPPTYEVNFDAIVGPTHNYAGLSYDNLASTANRRSASSPRDAALQGLAKMKLVKDLGLKQAILPPHPRPDVSLLRRLGFGGSDARVLQAAMDEEPYLLSAAYSASAMWVANAATVAPTPDAADGRLHLTPANLVTHLHRAVEAPVTTRILRTIFADEEVFAVHDPLPATRLHADEGAANHTRLCVAHGGPGLELFTYGASAAHAFLPGASSFPARQTLEASRAVARLHQLDPANTFYVQQNPIAIDAGVFHNDVIAVGNQNVLFYHRLAWATGESTVEQLRRRFAEVCGGELVLIEVTPEQVSLRDAVKTYLFNSQLLTLPDGSMALVCPSECREHPDTRALLDELVQRDDNPLAAVHHVNLHESMRNGGGPACLRLRVPMSDEQIAHMHGHVMFTDDLYETLQAWVRTHYRDQLSFNDLADPKLLEECHAALDELTRILGWGSVYDFQRG